MGIPLHLIVHKMHNSYFTCTSYYIGYNGVRVGVKRGGKGGESERERERTPFVSFPCTHTIYVLL